SDSGQRATPVLDARFIAPPPLGITLAHPSSWHVSTRAFIKILDPHVAVSNRSIGVLDDLDGTPGPRSLPSDAVLLVVFAEEFEAEHDPSSSAPFSGRVAFRDLELAAPDDTPGIGRRYTGAFACGDY